jgi:hypothetical protein
VAWFNNLLREFAVVILVAWNGKAHDLKCLWKLCQSPNSMNRGWNWIQTLMLIGNQHGLIDDGERMVVQRRGLQYTTYYEHFFFGVLLLSFFQHVSMMTDKYCYKDWVLEKEEQLDILMET